LLSGEKASADQGDISTGVVTAVTVATLPASPAWTEFSTSFVANAGARLASVYVAVVNGNSSLLYIDNVEITEERAMESLEASIARTGLWNGKAANCYHILGRRTLGWENTTSYGDVCEYLDTSQTLANIPTTAETLYIVSTSASDTSDGTGVRKVKVTYLDTNGAQQEVEATMNGTTHVSLGTGFAFIQWMESSEVGTGTVAAGTADLLNLAAASTSTFDILFAGDNA
jgi:hypothetical protein